jgi:hypothetical protein
MLNNCCKLVQNQYIVRIPTSILKQPIPVTKGVHVQQITMTTHMLMYMLPLDYLSTVMVFLSNNPKGLIHIHIQVENCLEVCLMEDPQKEDHMIKTHLEDHHIIHMLDFMDNKHMIQGYSCHHGINQF